MANPFGEIARAIGGLKLDHKGNIIGGGDALDRVAGGLSASQLAHVAGGVGTSVSPRNSSAPVPPSPPRSLHQRRAAAVEFGRQASAPARPAAPADGRNGFRDLAEFARAVRLANPAAGASFEVDRRLAAPTNVVMEYSDTAGSYLVPPEFRDEIVMLVYSDADPIVSNFAPRPTGRNRVALTGDRSTPWGASGVQAMWRVEGEQMQPSRATLFPEELKLGELYAYVLATEELLEDAPRVHDLLTREAAAAIRWKAADAFVRGDGIEKPLGYMLSGALVTIAKEAGQAADTIVPANVAKMFARMINPGRAIWIAGGDVLPQIIRFESPNGQLIWQEGLESAPGGLLLGRPLYVSEHAEDLGGRGDLQFVNPDGYLAFKRQNGVTFADSIHLYFDYNIRAFRWIFRIGGQPLLPAPVEPAHGGSTRSHFVALEERA